MAVLSRLGIPPRGCCHAQVAPGRPRRLDDLREFTIDRAYRPPRGTRERSASSAVPRAGAAALWRPVGPQPLDAPRWGYQRTFTRLRHSCSASIDGSSSTPASASRPRAKRPRRAGRHGGLVAGLEPPGVDLGARLAERVEQAVGARLRAIGGLLG